MIDIRSAVRELALPCPVGDRVKSAIERAAKQADIPYERMKKIWYGEARRIEAHEAEKIQRAWDRKKSKEEKRKWLNEWHQHRAQMARIESLLSQDEEFYSEMVAAFKHGMGRAG